MRKFAPLLVITLFIGVALAAQTTLTVTRQDDLDQLDEYDLAFQQLKRLASRKRSYEAQVAADTAAITSLGTKIRAHLVRYGENRTPVLDIDSLLPAALTDVEVDPANPGGGTKVYWNAAAETFRNQ